MVEKIISRIVMHLSSACIFFLYLSQGFFLFVFFFITQSIEIIAGIYQILSLDLGNKLSNLLYF